MVSTLSSTESIRRSHILRKLKSTAQQLKDLIETHKLTPFPSSTYDGPIPDLGLPFPHDILILIDDMDLPEHLSQKMKSKLTERVLQSQLACIESYKRTCQQLPGAGISFEYLTKLANTFRKVYEDNQMSQFRAKILAVKGTLLKVADHRSRPTKRPTFNSGYTPILENYFEHNAYPSRPDRILLARKSLMSERQIEVWFQNHRNRAKKEGIPLKRMSPHQISPLEFLQEKALPHDIPLERVPSSSQSDIDMLASLNGGLNAAAYQRASVPFPSSAPSPCTFPARYRRNPQNSFIDPLPQQERTTRFPPPIWPRKPATQRPSSPSINMEEFVAMFSSKLSIRRGSGMKSVNITSKARAWFSARVTIPSPAPHPALVRVKVLPRSSITTPSLSTIAPSFNIVTDIESNPSLSSISQPLTKNASKPRKMAPFPFRTPHKSPPPSIASSIHQQFSSRTWSFASVSSSQSRSSSASTGSSPAPTTPPHSPIIDSHDILETAVQESTSDNCVDLFAGIIDPQYDFSQNLDCFFNNTGDIFANKHLPILTHGFPYLDPLFAAM